MVTSFSTDLSTHVLTDLAVGTRVPRRTGAGVPNCSLGSALSSVQTGVAVTSCVLSCSDQEEIL